MPAQTNATVTSLGAGGRVDEWESAAAAAPAKWTGEVRGYYRARTSREQGPGGATNVILVRELILDVADVDLLELDTDDVITIELDGAGGPVIARAQTIPRVELPGFPAHLQTSRIRLEDG